MKKVLVDTNILIDFVHGCNKELERLLVQQEEGKIELYINPVIVTEFFNNTKLKNKAYFAKTSDFIQLFSISTITKNEGIIAGRLLREKKAFFLADSLIAASCLNNNYFLCTNNKKDFQTVPRIQFYS